ncbi:hypothetical protein [Mesorhizobium sp. M0036]|uniref:hypothetical protein n=1 Tax=Mesorhizobium sp. M0036 TaxID=2956853 RepID=UPI003339A064
MAKAGLKVLVLEGRHVIGGAARSEEVVWSSCSSCRTHSRGRPSGRGLQPGFFDSGLCKRSTTGAGGQSSRPSSIAFSRRATLSGTATLAHVAQGRSPAACGCDPSPRRATLISTLPV